MTVDPPIRDAATMIVLRDRQTKPSVLMGQRGKSAAFMPGKFVFPGGAVDPNDAAVPTRPMAEICQTRLADRSAISPQAIATAAIRELFEETGQVLVRAPPRLARVCCYGSHPQFCRLAVFLSGRHACRIAAPF